MLKSFRVFLMLCCACHALPAAASYSIDDVLSTPFASSLVAAPKGGRIAWVLNVRGRRNIWMAQPPAWNAEQVTQFNEDDGLDISQLTWTPNGQSLLFTRGADLESDRGDPNPTAAVAPHEHAIWIVPSKARPAMLSAGDGATVAPDGQRVWFLRKGQVYSAKLDGADARREFVLQGTAADLTWSPDGRQLAFSNQRSGHGYVGLFTVGSQQVRFLDPTVDTDESPVWSPDGTRLAFLRRPSTLSQPIFGAKREGYPWSIRMADISNLQTKELFHADVGPGSVYRALDASQQIFWTAADHVVFAWEKTGWLHLYRLNVTGAAAPPLELTPGTGEVENVALSNDRKDLYFNSNIGDLDTRHVARISADEAAPRPVALGSGEAVEWSPVPVAGTGAVALLASAFDTSAHAEILSASGDRKRLAPQTVPANFPAAALVKPESVVLPSADGLLLHAQLFRPRTEGKHPALVFFHGGSRRQMLPAFHYMYYYSNSYAMNQWLANEGYVVLAVNYRSGVGYGLNFREALQYGASGASEYNDVEGAGLYLRTRTDVDPRRIGAWGGSYGGYLTALALARSSHLFAAGVDFHGVHDWNLEFNRESVPGDAQAREEWERLAFASSPLAFVDTWRSPVLLIHGDDDRNVAFTQTIRLVEALRNRHVAVEQLIFPNEIHDFLLWRDWLTAYSATADFFSRKLMQTE